jgi:hypothetical protein
MFTTDQVRKLITSGIRQARAFRNWYRELQCTNAEMRAENLLKDWLSAEQLAQYEAYRYFDVIGGRSGTLYRVRYGTAMNITQLSPGGKVEAGLCFVPCEPLVAGDVMLAQKIALETDEWSALAVARRFSANWH